MHSRAESEEGKGETTVGAQVFATSTNQQKNTVLKHAAEPAAELVAPFFPPTTMTGGMLDLFQSYLK
jgi:hypothetical protein